MAHFQNRWARLEHFMNSLFFPIHCISLMIFQNTVNNCNNSCWEMICNLDKKLFQVQRQSASLEPHGNEY